MSKVIKATRLVVSFPRRINYQHNNISDRNLEQKFDDINKESDFDASGAEKIVAEAESRAEKLLREARLKAEEIIAAAREEANKIVEERLAEIERLKEEALKAGYEEGFVAGQKALNEERNEMQREMAAARAALEEERKNLIKEMEPELLQLAVYIAREIVHAELKLFPEQIRNLVRATLDRAKETGDVVLKVHPGDYEEIMNLLVEAGEKKIRVEVDSTIRNGCIVETPYGVLDGTIDGQLKEITHELVEVLSE